jgi:hypothetical protein
MNRVSGTNAICLVRVASISLRLRTVLLDEFLDNANEIGISGTKASCEPVPTALGNPLAIR